MSVGIALHFPSLRRVHSEVWHPRRRVLTQNILGLRTIAHARWATVRIKYLLCLVPMLAQSQGRHWAFMEVVNIKMEPCRGRQMSEACPCFRELS